MLCIGKFEENMVLSRIYLAANSGLSTKLSLESLNLNLLLMTYLFKQLEMIIFYANVVYVRAIEPRLTNFGQGIVEQ